MLLQREVAIPVWGKAAAGEKITLNWHGKNYQGVADDKGEWKIKLPASKASSKGSKLTVSDSSGKIVLDDIIIGDLWLASGQSNMQRPMSMFKDTKVLSKSYDNKDIRILQIDTLLATDGSKYSVEHYNKVKEQGGVSIKWKAFNPANAHQFSATASTFAHYLQEDSKVPIGIIGNAVGGSGVEAWLPQDIIATKDIYQSLQGGAWMDTPMSSAWARGRAKHNLTTVIASGTVPTEELEHPFKPSYLFERATKPLCQLPIKGVIWYQGETNAEDPDMDRNAAMLKDLVVEWRKAFNNENLPFIMVQLPRIKDTSALRAPWAHFREMQQKVSDELPNCELICTLDLGEANSDVHPSPKAPVGRRLADMALNKCYGKKLPTAPRITNYKWVKDGVLIKTSQATSCTNKDGNIKGFQLVLPGCDSPQDVPAKLKGNNIILSIKDGSISEEMKEKATITYNFAVFCEPNLVSKEGELPLFPWRSRQTDSE